MTPVWVHESQPHVVSILYDNTMAYTHPSYIPGWDCHGLPIENKVLKKLHVSK